MSICKFDFVHNYCVKYWFPVFITYISENMHKHTHYTATKHTKVKINEYNRHLHGNKNYAQSSATS